MSDEFCLRVIITATPSISWKQFLLKTLWIKKLLFLWNNIFLDRQNSFQSSWQTGLLSHNYRFLCHGACDKKRDRLWHVMTDVTPLAKYLKPFKYTSGLFDLPPPPLLTKNWLTCQYWGVWVRAALTTWQLLFGHIPSVYFVKNICWLSVCAQPNSSPTSLKEPEVKGYTLIEKN